MVRCRTCELLYLDPRPVGVEAERVTSGNGRDATAAPTPRRLARMCRDLPARARVLDLGCGDGFDLARMRELDASSYDLILGRRALERSGDPRALLGRMRDVLRPGGILIVEAGNAASPASRVFRDRYWGGYRFPRAWNIFTATTMSRLAAGSGLRVKNVATRVSPFGWIDSIRNALLDMHAPAWLVGRFTHDAPAMLALFTIVDSLGQAAGGGSVLCATLQRPPL